MRRACDPKFSIRCTVLILRACANDPTSFLVEVHTDFTVAAKLSRIEQRGVDRDGCVVIVTVFEMFARAANAAGGDCGAACVFAR